MELGPLGKGRCFKSKGMIKNLSLHDGPGSSSSSFMTKFSLVNVDFGSAVRSVVSLSFVTFSRKDASPSKGLYLLWAASCFVPEACALEQPSKGLQHAMPLTNLVAEAVQQSHTISVADLKAITRRAATVNVATEAALKAAILVSGNTIMLTQNITLTRTITISSGTITVSADVNCCEAASRSLISAKSFLFPFRCQIDGQGAYSVNGSGKDTCFSISGSSTSVTFNGLNIKNGYVKSIIYLIYFIGLVVFVTRGT